MDPRDEEQWQHGSTVLPGVPLPASAHPQGPVLPAGAEDPVAPPPAPAAAQARPETQPEPAAEPSDESPADEAVAATAATAAVKTPWWKKEIGGSKKGAAAAAASAAEEAAPPEPEIAEPEIAEPEMAEPEIAEPSIAEALPAPAAEAVPPPPAAGPSPEPAAVPVPVRRGAGRHQAPPPPSQGRGRLVVLLLLGALIVLAALAAFVWPGFLTAGDDTDDAGARPAATTSASPSPASPTVSPTVSALATVSLVTPASIAGLRRFTGKAATSLTASVATKEVPGLADPVSAVYGKGTTPQVQVIAWKATRTPPADTVEAAFTGFEGSSGADVSSVTPVPTGVLGGEMSCGLTTVSKTKALLCFWADDVSFGSLTVLRPTTRTAATGTAQAVRVAVERRS